jgi:hypothetical protein
MAKGRRRMVKAHELEKSHKGHSKHLCDLAARKLMHEVADLAKNAQYICHFCGRAAAKAQNLCEPVRI